MWKIDSGEIIFWGTIMTVVVAITGLFGYYMFVIAYSFAKLLTA